MVFKFNCIILVETTPLAEFEYYILLADVTDMHPANLVSNAAGSRLSHQ